MNHETAFVIKPLKSKIVLNRKSVEAFALVDGKDDYKDISTVVKKDGGKFEEEKPYENR